MKEFAPVGSAAATTATAVSSGPSPSSSATPQTTAGSASSFSAQVSAACVQAARASKPSRLPPRQTSAAGAVAPPSSSSVRRAIPEGGGSPTWCQMNPTSTAITTGLRAMPPSVERSTRRQGACWCRAISAMTVATASSTSECSAMMPSSRASACSPKAARISGMPIITALP